MTKQKTIQIRISENLLARFEDCLELEGLTKTIFLTSSIHRFVTETEQKQMKQKGRRKVKTFYELYVQTEDGKELRGCHIDDLPAVGDETYDEKTVVEIEIGQTISGDLLGEWYDERKNKQVGDDLAEYFDYKNGEWVPNEEFQVTEVTVYAK